MARKMNANGNSEDTGVTAQHNVKERDKQIKDAMEELYQADKRIAAALEKHVAPDREAKKDAKKKLRESLQLTTEVINVEYATYKLTRQSQDNGDDATLDLIREMHERLPLGGTLNFDDALKAQEAETEQPTA